MKQELDKRNAELRESERRYRTLLANLQGMAYRCRNNRDWTMEFVSEGCRELLGIEPADFHAGRRIYTDLIHLEDRERVWNEVQTAIAEQKAFSLEYRVKHANGQWRSVWEQGRAVLDDQGKVCAIEGFITDITQRVDAEQAHFSRELQLRRAQKLEAIATLAGGIAHDFNNILAGILGSAELIKMDMETTHPSRESLDQIFVAVARAREVVQRIKTFSLPPENAHGLIYLQPIIEECVKLLRSSIPARVEISDHSHAACPPVLADSTEIHQVMMILLTNAWQALPERGGSIKVTLEKIKAEETIKGWQCDLPAGLYARLSVSDTGSGMDAGTFERLFEPFFTTKPIGQGSGLGLSVMLGIVKAHGGAIAVESQPGNGTTFQIYLPAQNGFEADAPGETTGILKGNNESILLVDDDEAAGQMTGKILKRMGYRVNWFKHPEAALADFQQHPLDYDLVITDLAMPAMSGDHLAAALLEIRPDLEILLTTGQIEPAKEKRVRQLGVGNVLLKPASIETLGRAVARQLAHRNGTQ